MNCGSQITICDLPIRYDTYKGCSHQCKYCFVQRGTRVSAVGLGESPNAVYEFAKGKRNALTKWCDWDIPIHWGGMSDPFQPAEIKYRRSLEALRAFNETQYPFVVSTKGRIIAEPQYLELIKDCKCVVQISMVCDKYDKIELGAPSFVERLDIVEKIAQTGTRVNIRIQPYMREVFEDVIRNIKSFKSAGAHGIIIEGYKATRKMDGMERAGVDYVYKADQLERDFQIIKEEAHSNGLVFYCGENRLREMGDHMCCCGVEGLDGFKPNEFNLIHLMRGEKVEPTSAMLERGSAKAFGAIYQTTAACRIIKELSMAEIMLREAKKQQKKQRRGK